MAKIVSSSQRLVTSAMNPGSVYTRVFGLACKAALGIGVGDFAYSPPMGKNFWLKFMSIWYGGSNPTDDCGGTIYLSSGSGIPRGFEIAQDWEIIVPFWAGITKPAIMVLGREGYLAWPMNRLYTGEALRFGLQIENGSAVRPFWVNAWFEISEG